MCRLVFIYDLEQHEQIGETLLVTQSYSGSTSEGNTELETELLDNKMASETEHIQGSQSQPHICSDGPHTDHYHPGERS